MFLVGEGVACDIEHFLDLKTRHLAENNCIEHISITGMIS